MSRRAKTAAGSRSGTGSGQRGRADQTALNATRWNLGAAAVVFAVALAVRLIFLLSSPDRTWPHSMYYEGDAPVWVKYATALDKHTPFEFDLPLRSPAVAYLMHWLSMGPVQGPFTDFKVLWCVISAASCALAFGCFALVMSRRAALIGAFLCVFSFGSYVTATSLNNEALYTFVLTAIALSTLWVIRRPSFRLAAGLGVLHGLATLIRPEHTLLLLMLLAFMAWRWRKPAVDAAASNWTTARRTVALAMVVAASILTCLPWSIHASLAAQRFNRMAPNLPDYDKASPPWTTDARAFMDSLPSFARGDSFKFISTISRKAGDREVTADRARSILLDNFSALPEPLSRWNFISCKGPLDFALANHPKSDGGFSKAALLVEGLGDDPKLNLTLPPHLRLVNHGYSVAWGWITADPVGWLTLVGHKLSNFLDGVTLGFGAHDLPLGRGGVRRPIDLVTAGPGEALVWRVAVLLLIGGGMIMAARRRIGGIWFVIIGSKIIVTILFYGYARQAVSILPAFYCFIAVALDLILTVADDRFWIARRWGILGWIIELIAASVISAILGGVIVASMALRDALAASRVVALRIEGPKVPAPQWGHDAFESLDRITIAPAANPTTR